MDPEDWRQRWREGRIGFHLERENPALVRFHHRLDAHPGEPVFVPLCGKSKDLAWLAGRGHGVVGVEASPLAVEAFFTEHGRSATRRRAGALECWEDPPLRIWCGDFFDLSPGDLDGARLFYDRAALIALPPPLRIRYAAHIATLLPDTARGLLLTLEYPQHEMAGPPFSVPEEEVRGLYEEAFAVHRLARNDVLAEHERFRAAGLSALHEAVYLLERR